MSTKDAMKYIGQTATYRINKLAIQVEVIDVRSVYGKTQYQITPAAGSGEVWVEDLSFQDLALKGAGVTCS
jgi:hypothetical protein